MTATTDGVGDDSIVCTIFEKIEEFMNAYTKDTVQGIEDIYYLGSESEQTGLCNGSTGSLNRAIGQDSTLIGSKGLEDWSIALIVLLIFLLLLCFCISIILYRRRKSYKDNSEEIEELNELKNDDASYDTVSDTLSGSGSPMKADVSGHFRRKEAESKNLLNTVDVHKCSSISCNTCISEDRSIQWSRV